MTVEVVAWGLTFPQWVCLGILLWLAGVLATRRRHAPAEGLWW